MQQNLLWTGREYYSLENCVVSITEEGADIQSGIIGKYGDKLYRVEYSIKTNQLWQTLAVELKGRHSNHEINILLQGDGKGNWKMNGEEATAFSGCIDVDIPLTPLTNTLPIRRLSMKKDEPVQIPVIYIDVLEERITVVKQQYMKLSDREYHYENVPNDFEATIKVDEYGLVVNYPLLFERTAVIESGYNLK